MFEKEAEEWVKGNTEIFDDEILGLECIKEPSAKEAYLYGAEFGYGKGTDEAREIIEGLMRFCRCFAQHHTEDIRYKEAEQFLKEVSE